MSFRKGRSAQHHNEHQSSAGCCRLYINIFKFVFTLIILEDLESNHARKSHDNTIPLDLSKTPVLYLYGTDKKIMFDDEQVHEYVRREGRKPENKSDAIAVDNAGHWLYHHQEDCCIDHVKKFILS